MSSFRRVVSAGDERCGRVLDILEIRSPAKSNMKRNSHHRRFHCFSRIAGEPGIAIHAVNSQGAEAGARESMRQKVDPGVALVSSLEHAVMCTRLRDSSFIKRHVVLA